MPSLGTMAVANTSTPMPPSQWVKARQNRMPLGRASMSVRMVEPVVVKPEQDSKIASIGVANQPEKRKGRAPTSPVNIQISATAAKPSRVKNCCRAGRADRPRPTAATMAMASRKGVGSSRYSRATARGRTRAAASSSSTRPTSLKTSLMFISRPLPQ